ncbi:MAG: response regulator transcription factor [Pirellulaceae bacterium]
MTRSRFHSQSEAPMANAPLHHDSPHKHGGPSKGRPPHVLLVEDDDVMRAMLAEAFRREGWQVTECADAMRWLQSCVREATRRDVGDYTATATPYDVVVSDIRMPNVGGLDALRILREIHCDDACPPTIFITAFGDEETHKRARDLGAVTVLDKPFAMKDLLQRVRSVANAQFGAERDQKK